MPSELAQTVVVLDLDDTLYPEADYHASGVRAVCEIVEALYGKQLLSQLQTLHAQGEQDLWGAICRITGMPLTVKNSLLWIYRLHMPIISLSNEIKMVIKYLEANCCAVAILTDGRSISQRQKLRALNLSHLPLYISEEYGSEKPNVLRYKRIMQDFPAQIYVYVGDNPNKDFIGPNSLGWKSIGLRGGKHNVHSQACEDLPLENLPQIWIDSLNKLIGSLC
jgi:putative hydrolase of the HAD superfamily